MELRSAIDWANLGPLRIRSRVLAEGIYTGMHRSVRRGSGVEFFGHRNYVPGDDLRWLDWRNLMRHERLLIRQYETETERGMRIVLDATASMAYQGDRARGSKLAYVALLAATLARLASRMGDPVGLSAFGTTDVRIRPSAGREGLERILSRLEALTAGGDALESPEVFEKTMQIRARRGSILVCITDAIDLPEGGIRRIAELGGKGRTLVVVQCNDPDERTFPFTQRTRFQGFEGKNMRDVDPERVREGYLQRFTAHSLEVQSTVETAGGRYVSIDTSEAPESSLQRIVEAIR